MGGKQQIEKDAPIAFPGIAIASARRIEFDAVFQNSSGREIELFAPGAAGKRLAVVESDDRDALKGHPGKVASSGKRDAARGTNRGFAAAKCFFKCAAPGVE